MSNIADHIGARGRVAATLTMEVGRELGPLDLLRLGNSSVVAASQPAPLKTIRAIHHRQAQLLAQGKKIVDVAIIVGSTATRIQQLMHDPQFKELLAYYTAQVLDAEHEDASRIATKLRDVAEMAVDELTERFSDDVKRKAMANKT